jgi:hypothetical protein
MKGHLFIVLALVAQLGVVPLTALAHRGSGIVVDAQGNVYFTHTGRGVGKLDPHGKLTYVGSTGGGHWLCLDVDGSFSRSQPKYFERITSDGAKPAPGAGLSFAS